MCAKESWIRDQHPPLQEPVLVCGNIGVLGGWPSHLPPPRPSLSGSKRSWRTKATGLAYEVRGCGTRKIIHTLPSQLFKIRDSLGSGLRGSKNKPLLKSSVHLSGSSLGTHNLVRWGLGPHRDGCTWNLPPSRSPAEGRRGRGAKVN